MKVFAVQLVDHSFGIRVILIEDELALTVPPEPVLDDVVDGNMQIPILLRNRKNFFLRLVAVLALPKSISPLSKHGGLTSQLAITRNNFVELRPVKEEVVDHVGYFRAYVHVIGKAVVDFASRIIVPINSVAVARN